MLKRYGDSAEMPSAIRDFIECHYINNDHANHVEKFFEALLDEDEHFIVPTFLIDLIYVVVYYSDIKYSKEDLKIIKKRIFKIMSEVINISDALESNISFTNHLVETIKKNEFFRKLKREFASTRKSMLLALNEEEAYIKEYYENFFASCLSQITPEFYFILKEADILTLISRYNENDKCIDDDLTLKVIKPLCGVLEILLIEEKADVFDFIYG